MVPGPLMVPEPSFENLKEVSMLCATGRLLSPCLSMCINQ